MRASTSSESACSSRSASAWTVPDQLDRDLLAGRSEHGAAVALVLDEPEGRESFQDGGDGRWGDAHPLCNRGRPRASVLFLELVDLLEVVLDGFAELA